MAINLVTDDPDNPSGAHWFWTRAIPEMASHLTEEEEFHLVVSRRSKPQRQGYGPRVRCVTFPWSNELRNLRTLSEHVYAPMRLPLAGIDVLSTLIADSDIEALRGLGWEPKRTPADSVAEYAEWLEGMPGLDHVLAEADAKTRKLGVVRQARR